jgi:cytoskeleton protein RodZ
MATGIGEALRDARRRQGRTLAEAAAETRVRETYLAALEEEDFTALGGDIYAKGFIRSYARFLRIDPEPLVRVFREHYEQQEEPSPLAHTPVGPVARERQPGWAVLAGVVGVLLVIVVGLGLRSGGTPEPVSSPPPPPVRESPPVAVTPPPVAEDAEPSPTPPAVEGADLTLTVTGPVAWIRVLVDGERELERELSNGFTTTFRGQEEVFLRIGDAAAVSVTFNGHDQGVLGGSGQVIELRCLEGTTECELDVVA